MLTTTEVQHVPLPKMPISYSLFMIRAEAKHFFEKHLWARSNQLEDFRNNVVPPGGCKPDNLSSSDATPAHNKIDP